MAGLKVITPPADEPVTPAEIKTQLRIEDDDTSYDDVLTPLIVAAREWCEGFQNRAYVEQTIELALDAWPKGKEIKLPRPPLIDAVSLSYTDEDGATTTWPESNYIVDDFAEPARLVKVQGVCWPAVCLSAANGIKIRYVAGYPADELPQRVKQAIILLVSHWFESGICDPPAAVLSLLRTDRVMPV